MRATLSQLDELQTAKNATAEGNTENQVYFFYAILKKILDFK